MAHHNSHGVKKMSRSCVSVVMLPVSIVFRFVDEDGVSHEWEKLDKSMSELIQHECDHLNGVLAM